jgi:hypothetical protein
LWNNDHARFIIIGQVTEKFKKVGEQKQVTGWGIKFLWELKYVWSGNISAVFPEL